MDLNVRSFKAEDGPAVKSICRTHFRSLCIPAVQYYCLEHFRDLLALLVIGMLFQSFRDLVCAAALFIVYLFVRARVELEFYIQKDSPDLDDICSHYMMNDPNSRSHFWVAEASFNRNSKADGSRNAPQVVGCIGCHPTRDDPSVVQLVRLVVAKDARRMRNGSRLLAQFEHFAIEKGYKSVRLYTNNLNTSHMKFVRQHGYEIVQCVSRSLMRGCLIQWRKVLKPSVESSAAETSMDASVYDENSSCPRTNTLNVMD